MNDFPTLKDTKIQTSLYADDSAVWKTDKNQKRLYEYMQKL